MLGSTVTWVKLTAASVRTVSAKRALGPISARRWRPQPVAQEQGQGSLRKRHPRRASGKENERQQSNPGAGQLVFSRADIMTETLTQPLPDDIENLAEKVLRTACGRDLMLATAESCTGGLLASVLTDVEGVAHAFDRGFVTYTNQAKTEVLGIPQTLSRVMARSRQRSP